MGRMTIRSRSIFTGEATGNSSTFGLYALRAVPAGPALTQNFTPWNISSSPSDHWELGMTKDTPDLTPVIQEIINRPDWSSGNALSDHRQIHFRQRHQQASPCDRLRPASLVSGNAICGKVGDKVSAAPLIFVPGTGGTELHNIQSGRDTLLWLDKGELGKGLSNGDTFLDPLQFDGSEFPQPIDLNVYPAQVMQTEAGTDVYQTFIDYMTSSISYDFPGQSNYVLGQVGGLNNDHVINPQSGQNFWLLPTDFRNDLSGQADRLDALVTDVLKDTGASQVDIVAHSQGGLIVRQYILDNGRAAKVHQIVTLGTPYLGVPRVFQALRYGWDFGIEKFGFPVISPVEVKKLAQNWPGAYEQLPANDPYLNSMGAYFGTSRDLNLDGQPDGYFTSRAAMDALLEQVVISDDNGLATHYNKALIQKAEQFQSDGIHGWQALPQAFNRTVIVGSGKCTPSYYWEFLSPDQKVKVDVLQGNGDDTVPLNSADMNSGSGTAHVYFADAQKIGGHTALPDGLAKDVASLLITGQPFNDLATPKSASCSQFELFSQANLQVANSSDNITGPIPNSQSYQTNIPNSDFFLFPNNQIAVVPSGGPYTLSVNGTGDGTFDLRLREWQDSTINSTILYKDVPVSAMTKAQLVYQNGSNPPILQLDENGDGIYETQIPPTSILGSHLPDETPPTTSIQVNGTPGLNGWYTSNATVTLSAVDNLGGTGVLKTIYSLDGGATFQTYSGPFVISQEGTTTILAQSIDREGNEETPPVSLAVQIR